jgi:hypothetical protein
MIFEIIDCMIYLILLANQINSSVYITVRQVCHDKNDSVLGRHEKRSWPGSWPFMTWARSRVVNGELRSRNWPIRFVNGDLNSWIRLWYFVNGDLNSRIRAMIFVNGDQNSPIRCRYFVNGDPQVMTWGLTRGGWICDVWLGKTVQKTSYWLELIICGQSVCFINAGRRWISREAIRIWSVSVFWVG